MADDRKPSELPAVPRLPERAAIYIAPDGNVHFGALFEGLVPVAQALGAPALKQPDPPAGAAVPQRSGSDPGAST